MKYVLIILAILLLSYTASCTTKKANENQVDEYGQVIGELKIKDQSPDFEIENVINYKKSSIKLSDLRGKLVIIDFWATWCKACIKHLPKVDSLQQKYRDKLQVIAVTRENEETVTRFFEKTKNETLKNIQLPIALNDTLLLRYFKHTMVPHYVWIDREGVVQAITGSEEVNDENIEKMIRDSENMALTEVKKDINYNTKVPLIPGLSPEHLDVNYYSVLTGYVDGLFGMSKPIAHPSYDLGKQDDMRRIVTTNHNIQQLFQMAFSKGDLYFMSPNRTKFEVTDSIPFTFLWKKEWPKKKKDSLRHIYNFCYDLIMPSSVSSDQMYKTMQEDLNRFFKYKFGISAKMEKRKVRCLIAVRTSKENKLKSGGDKQVDEPVTGTLVSPDANSYSQKNKPLDNFFHHLTLFHLFRHKLPIVNETGFTDPVDITIKADTDLSDIEALRKEMRKYGLDFIEGDREIDMIVISDTD